MRGSSNAYNLVSVYVFNSITWSRKLTNIYSTAGKVYSLTCDVSLSQNLRQSPVIEWVGPDGNVIDNTTLRDVSLTSSSPSTTMTLLFNPLRTSHRGMYLCRATLTDTAANIRLMNTLTVEILVQG